MKTSENSTHNRNEKNWQRRSEPTFAALWKLTKGLHQSVEYSFIHEKWLPYNSQLCGIFTCAMPIFCSPAFQWPWEFTACNHRESQQPGNPWRMQNRFETVKSSFLESCHYLICLAIPQKTPHVKLYLSCLGGADSLPLSGLAGGLFWKTIRGKWLTSQLFEE